MNGLYAFSSDSGVLADDVDHGFQVMDRGLAIVLNGAKLSPRFPEGLKIVHARFAEGDFPAIAFGNAVEKEKSGLGEGYVLDTAIAGGHSCVNLKV